MTHAVLAKGISVHTLASRHQRQMHIHITTTFPQTDHMHRISRQKFTAFKNLTIHNNTDGISTYRTGTKHTFQTINPHRSLLQRIGRLTTQHGVFYICGQLLRTNIIHRAIIQCHGLKTSISTNPQHHQIGDIWRNIASFLIIRTSHQAKDTQ